MRFWRIITPILIVALLLSACGPAAPNNADAITESGRRFKLALPRLIIDFDQQGSPSFLGLSAEQLATVAGMPADALKLPGDTVSMLQDSGIQHVELSHTDGGIFLFLNAQPMPQIVWDSESLANVSTVAELFGLPVATLIGLLRPLIERTGLNIVIRVPAAAGQTEIALRDMALAPEAAVAAEAPDKLVFLADVDLAANGSLTFAGINTAEITEATGVDLSAMQVDPQLLADLKAGGVQELQILNRPNGIFVTVNGMALPHVGWNEEILGNTANLYGQLNPEDPVVKLVNLIAPDLNRANVDLLVRFPQ